MTTVVLGWDALDSELVDEFGVAGYFGTHRTRLQSISNPDLEKPHTYEMWPTIITGLRPEHHGLNYEKQVGTQWSNPLLNVAERLSRPIPESVRWRVGRLLRDHGAGFDYETLDYYEKNGFETIFDGRSSYPLAIPNARSCYDDELGIVPDRGAYLAEYLNVSTADDGTTTHSLSGRPAAFRRRIESDMAYKLGAVRAAADQDFDLVFVWLAYLDTMGHVAPTLEDSTAWQRLAYQTAARATADIRYSLELGDDLLVVSDHGLRDGTHTEDAVFGKFNSDGRPMPGSVLEVAETIGDIAPVSGPRDDPHSASQDKADFQGVEERIEELGYLE